MTNAALLNNIEHKDLRVITRPSAEYGDNAAIVAIFPTEFGDVQRDFPIFFRKDPQTGEFMSIALLGFEEDENLFLSEGEWRARYLPAILARGPFLIGFQEQLVEGKLCREPVIHVDLDSPRLSVTEGEPVFLEFGGNSPYIERVAATLQKISDGDALSRDMFNAFNEAQLIEPVSIEVEIDEFTRYDLAGLFTINEERLAALDAGKLEQLHRLGFLKIAFNVVDSIDNMQTLISMKRAKRFAAASAQ